jgi:predicted nucleic acid-binding protein
MKPYADTNFFTRLYLPLPESEQAVRLLGLAKSSKAIVLPVTWLHRMELAHAFEISVWLSKQGGHPRISSQNAAVAHENFKDDLASETYLGEETIEISALQSLFEDTVARHTARHGFRVYDILHVVSARLLGCDHFFSFDVRANKLAQIEGLKNTLL